MSEHTKCPSRYTFSAHLDDRGDCDCDAAMFPNEFGEYVSWKDYAALQSANAELVEVLQELDNMGGLGREVHLRIQQALAKHKGGGK